MPRALVRLCPLLPRALSSLHPCLAALALACSEPTTPACATQIAAEVCATPAQPRGADPVQPGAGSTSVQLPSSPLAEGRYVLVSSSYSCPEGAEAPASAPLRGVLELSGCVLRRTLLGEAPEPASVEVFEVGEASEGLLSLQRRCTEEPQALRAAYGFDGERLELGRLQPATTIDADGQAAGLACDTLERWELR